MTAFLVFNDLSAAAIARDLRTGREYLDGFTNVLLDQRIKGKKVLVTPPAFLSMQVTPGYSVGRWLAEDSPADHERRLRLKTLLDRRSHYDEYVQVNQLESDEEYRYDGQTAHGLTVAYSIDGLAISFLSGQRWDFSLLNLEKSWVDGGDVATHTFAIVHASRPAHLEDHVGWLRAKQPNLPENGLELWRQRSDLFPSLDFCSAVEDQITSLGGDGPRFRAVMRGLQDLQRYCEEWEANNFDIHGLSGASGESQSTLSMYAAERTFVCPDGEYRLFDWHLKRGDTRIHFLDFPSTKRILVGYAGAHLRISSE
jgi:hypothetical protein